MPKDEKRGSRVAALYPLTKFYLALSVAAAALLAPGILPKAVCLAAVFILAAVSGVGGLFARRMRNSIGILILILIVIQTLFYPTGTPMFSFWIFTAKKEGLLFAIRLSLNIACVAGVLIWFFAVTTERDFVLSLEKQGLSPKASYVVLSTLQMVPVMKKRSMVIMNAQRARGVETEGSLFVRAKVFLPTLAPLVLGAIQGIEERALTLEARGFSVETPSTHLRDIHRNPVDRVVEAAAAALVIAAVVGRILLWLI